MKHRTKYGILLFVALTLTVLGFTPAIMVHYPINLILTIPGGLLTGGSATAIACGE